MLDCVDKAPESRVATARTTIAIVRPDTTERVRVTRVVEVDVAAGIDMLVEVDPDLLPVVSLAPLFRSFPQEAWPTPDRLVVTVTPKLAV